MEAHAEKSSVSSSPPEQKRLFRDLRGHTAKVARALELKRRRRIERVIQVQRKRKVHQSR